MFGDRLKLARKKCGYSLRELSKALEGEVSAQAIGKYERGEMMPGSTTLTRLAKALHVTPDYLLSDRVRALEGLEFRKLSGISVRDRARVEATVIEHLERYLDVEEILSLPSAEWEPPELNRKTVKNVEDAERLADELRQEWKLGIDPIPNMTALLEEHGIKVLMLELPDRVSGLTCMVARDDDEQEVPVIVVNEGFPLERRRHTLAHELAHRVMRPRAGVDPEKAAHRFAGAFLVTRDHLLQEIGKHRNALGYNELLQLKRMYRVSAAALLVRLERLEIIDKSTLSYAFQTFARGWRKTEPEPIEGEGENGQRERPRRFERLCYWALAEGYISPAKAAELLQKSLQDIEQAMKGPSEHYAGHR